MKHRKFPPNCSGSNIPAMTGSVPKRTTEALSARLQPRNERPSTAIFSGEKRARPVQEKRAQADLEWCSLPAISYKPKSRLRFAFSFMLSLPTCQHKSG